MPFPAQRLRRLRLIPKVRERLSETELSPRRLIMPFFVRPGQGIKVPIKAMPGHYQRSPDVLLKDIAVLQKRGLESILLFGIPAHKDPLGSDAYAAQGIIQRTVRLLKKKFPGIARHYGFMFL